MADRVLVPYDGSTPATDALDHACSLFPEATIVLLQVTDPAEAGSADPEQDAVVSDDWHDAAREAAEETLERARERAGDRDIETHHEIGRPSRAIVSFVEDHDIDHVVMGSHGRTGVARLLLGSVAEAVVRRSPVPVTVVR